jgi:hypothetical protein
MCRRSLRSTHGRRILRLCVNLHPTDARVWATSDTFDKLLERFGPQIGLPQHTSPWLHKVGRGLLRIFQPNSPHPSAYDDFMLRLHHFLKFNEQFQERALKRIWHFPPGAAWLLFSDYVSHAELRGRYALEHSFLVGERALERPDLAPRGLLTRMCAGRIAEVA